MESQTLFWRVDHIYEFAPFFLEQRKEHTR